MKRIGHLYERATSPAALLAAFHAASRRKRATRACYQFERHLAGNLDALCFELAEGRYRPQPYYSFMINEPKPRRIYAPAFRDLVVQHAVYAIAAPIFESGFIDQSFACRRGLGTHAAADHAQAMLAACPRDSYTLKLDVRKFFYRIDRAILRGLVERKIKDQRFVDLMMAFADHGEPIGIPIGNLLSQVFALIYLDPVDHYIKRELKVSHYARYVDDLLLAGLTRERAIECREAVGRFLFDNLGLEYSKTTLARVTRGVNFVGYRTWASRRFVRRRALWTFRAALVSGDAARIASCLGHARRTHSLRHMQRTMKEHSHAAHHPLPQAH